MKFIRCILSILIFSVTSQIISSQEVSQDHRIPGEKIFSFGVVADIQYADAEKAGKRDYRGSLQKLDTCIHIFNKHELSFTITLGDMIDRDYNSFDKPLAILKKLQFPVYNVPGNHDFSMEDRFKRKVKKQLNNKKGYFDFEAGTYRFILLDGTDVSTFAHKKGSAQYKNAMAHLEEMKKKKSNNAYDWNGGIGDMQLKWLDKKLNNSDHKNQKVIIFCHWPLLPENGTQLWNNREVLELLNSHKSVVAWIAGHHHEGGYEKAGEIHYLTLKGLVEAQSETSCGIIEVYPERLLLKGYGDQNDQLLKFTR